jgi:hypothetical protein
MELLFSMFNHLIYQPFHVKSKKDFLENLYSFLETIVQALVDAQYILDSSNAEKLSWILGLPHFHHHEKRSVTKTASSISLTKQGLHPSPSFVINNLTRRGIHSLLLLNLSFYLSNR